MVWYRRPEGSGEKLDSRWLGPAVVLKRVGENSYELQIAETKTIRAHVSYMKPYVTDVFNGNPKPVFYHHRTLMRHPTNGSWIKFWTTEDTTAICNF